MKLVVVVPTRNRADLASRAIESTLDDRDGRVSVLVSDNSTETAHVRSLRDTCVAMPRGLARYIRPPAPLSMTAHWQWALERAVESPDTTHVMYMSDRRVLRPGALPDLLAIVERHPSDVVTFRDDAMIRDDNHPVTLSEYPWTGRLMRVDTDQMLRIAARGIAHVAVPRMLNSIVPRAVLRDIDQAYGNVFASIAPDHCFGYRCLDRVDSILHWDRVLVVQRALLRSNGYSQIRGIITADHADFLRELRESRINEQTPVPELLTITNAAFNEYEFVRREPASSKLAPLWRHYYLGANARDVSRLEDPQMRSRMDNVLSEHGWSRWMRLRYLVGLSASAASYYGRRPGALFRRLRTKTPTPAEFGDSEQALAFALEHQGVAAAESDHLWPLMSRPGAACELPVEGT